MGENLPGGITLRFGIDFDGAFEPLESLPDGVTIAERRIGPRGLLEELERSLGPDSVDHPHSARVSAYQEALGLLPPLWNEILETLRGHGTQVDVAPQTDLPPGDASFTDAELSAAALRHQLPERFGDQLPCELAQRLRARFSTSHVLPAPILWGSEILRHQSRCFPSQSRSTPMADLLERTAVQRLVSVAWRGAISLSQLTMRCRNRTAQPGLQTRSLHPAPRTRK